MSVYPIAIITFILIIAVALFLLCRCSRDKSNRSIDKSELNSERFLKQSFKNCKEETAKLDTDTIFISIANYRDDDCKNTLTNLYKTAKNPEKIFVGILSQYDLPEESCEVLNLEYPYNVRYINVPASLAKGPLFARTQIINKLYHGESYYLMIDAHTRFIDDWDKEAKDQLNYLMQHGISKPILSTYAPSYDNYKKNNNHTTLLCNINDGHKIPTVLHAIEIKKNEFRQGYFLSGNATFTFGKFIQDIDIVCVAGDLKHIFGGEEILFSILAYTHGWDIFCFAKPLFYHHYYHSKPSWYDDNKKHSDFFKVKERSEQELIRLLTKNPDGNKLGKERKLEDFWKLINYNTNSSNFEKNWNPDANRLCTDTKIIKYKR